MTTKVKVWQVKDKKLILIDTSLREQNRKEPTDLEPWIKSYPELLGQNLLIIGNQIQTKGGTLDFLAVDEKGNIIIIELKRDKLRRDVLAQAIDYASDIESWDFEELDNACRKFTNKNLWDFIIENFPNEDITWDEISFNQTQRILLVGTSIEEPLERMINWLSENYQVLINCVIITYGKTFNGEEIIAATTIIPEEIETEHSANKNKRMPKKNLEDHRNIIKNKDLKEYFIDTEQKIKEISEEIEEQTTGRSIVFKYKGHNVAELWPREKFFCFFFRRTSKNGKSLKIENVETDRENMFEVIRQYIKSLSL